MYDNMLFFSDVQYTGATIEVVMPYTYLYNDIYLYIYIDI